MLHGDALDKTLLEEAQAGQAETIVSVTNDDETNIFTSVLAKQAGCKRAITLVNKSSYENLIPTLGIDAVVSPSAVTISTVLRHIRRGPIVALYTLREDFGEVIEAEITESSRLLLRPLNQLGLPQGMKIGAVMRDGEVFVPTGETRFEEGDHIVALVTYSYLHLAEALLECRKAAPPMSAAVHATGIAAQGIKPVLHLTGLVLLATAATMVFPMIVDIYYRHADWQAFAAAAMVSAVIGGLLVRYSRKSLKTGLTLRQSFLLTPLSWVSVAAVSALPFFFSDYGAVSNSLADAVFESVSGITTTGATVISGLEDAPPGILLWRALLQWMGGIGIIATAIAILPALGIGGMQLFRTESSDRSEKAMPRVRQIAGTIALVYACLTVLAFVVYWLAGMRPFDALTQPWRRFRQESYSTSDASFAAWDESGIQWFATLFMLSGTIPFVVYVRLIAGEGRRCGTGRSDASGLPCGGRHHCRPLAYLSGQYALEPAFRYAAFNVVSVVTTTGFASADYTLWGNWAVGLFFGLMFVGGCTGSTSGGIKIFRYEVMALMLRAHFMRLLYTYGVFSIYYCERLIDDEVVGSVVAFFAVFFLCYALLTVALMGFGLDFLTSASGAATALSNIGPGLGGIIGPTGNFGPLPDGAKWLMSLGMLLGRLELFTVLILFAPASGEVREWRYDHHIYLHMNRY